MDLNLAASAHHLPDNQFVFDQVTFEQSILRAEKRRLFLRSIWTGLRALAGRQTGNPKWINEIALQEHPL